MLLDKSLHSNSTSEELNIIPRRTQLAASYTPPCTAGIANSFFIRPGLTPVWIGFLPLDTLSEPSMHRRCMPTQDAPALYTIRTSDVATLRKPYITGRRPKIGTTTPSSGYHELSRNKIPPVPRDVTCITACSIELLVAHQRNSRPVHIPCTIRGKRPRSRRPASAPGWVTHQQNYKHQN